MKWWQGCGVIKSDFWAKTVATARTWLHWTPWMGPKSSTGILPSLSHRFMVHAESPLFLLLVDTLPAIFTVALGHWILMFVSSDFAHDSCPRSSKVFVGAIFGGGNPSLFRIVFHYGELGASWPLEYDRLHNPHGHMEGVVHATLALRANCLSCSLHIKSTNEIDRGTRSDRIKCFPAHALES